MDTVNYNIRLDPDIKMQAEETFSAFGLDLSDAFNVFLHKAVMCGGFPFEVSKKPNEMLLESMAEADLMMEEYENGTRTPRSFTTAREMFAAMDLECEMEETL